MQYQSTGELRALAKSLKKALASKAPDLKLGQVLDALAQSRGFSSWNAAVTSEASAAIDQLLLPHERNHIFAAEDADLRAAETGEGGYGPECVIRAHTGFQLRSPSYPLDCDYLRVCDPLGREIAYWTADEWKASPEEVIGAVMGALARSSSFAEPKAAAKRDPVIQDVQFMQLSEVIYAGSCHAVAWREEGVLAELHAPNPSEDSLEETALHLHREEAGLVHETQLSLQELLDFRWNKELRCFQAPDGTEFKPYYSMSFADVVGA